LNNEQVVRECTLPEYIMKKYFQIIEIIFFHVIIRVNEVFNTQ
jgi:hypothetical protein